MITCWMPIPEHPDALAARLYDCRLEVDHEGRRWRWTCLDSCDHVLDTGTEAHRSEAMSAAIDDFFALHPPGGRWFEHRCGDVTTPGEPAGVPL